MCGFVHLARFSGFSLQNFLLAITGSYISQSLRCNQITNFKTMKHHIRVRELLTLLNIHFNFIYKIQSFGTFLGKISSKGVSHNAPISINCTSYGLSD